MTDETAPAQTAHIEVVKSALPSFLSAQAEVGLDGEFLWPLHPNALLMLYDNSPEHCRAIHVKAEGAFGGGLIGDTDKLDEVFEAGSADCFGLLGLDLETFGNAFMQRIWSLDKTRIIQLRRLPAATMRRYRDGFMQLVAKPDGSVKRVTFTKDEIVHFRDPCPHGGAYSRPTWIGAQNMLALADAATRYNAKFFQNNAMPEYAVIYKGKAMPAKIKTEIQEFFSAQFQGLDNAHRTLIIQAPEDGSIDFEKITADVKDADFLKLLDAARDRIPTAHGVQPRILGIISSGSLGGGGEAAGQMFAFEHTTLMPRRRRMLDQMRPTLKHFGLKPGVPDREPKKGEVLFRPLDLTPPKDDAENVTDWVNAGIIAPEQGAALIPALRGLNRATVQGDSEGAGTPIERSAHQNTLNALAAILAKL